MSQRQIVLFFLLGVALGVELFPANFGEAAQEMLVVLQHLVLVLRFVVDLGKGDYFGVEVVQHSQEDGTRRQFLHGGDEEVLLF